LHSDSLHISCVLETQLSMWHYAPMVYFVNFTIMIENHRIYKIFATTGHIPFWN